MRSNRREILKKSAATATILGIGAGAAAASDESTDSTCSEYVVPMCAPDFDDCIVYHWRIRCCPDGCERLSRLRQCDPNQEDCDPYEDCEEACADLTG